MTFDHEPCPNCGRDTVVMASCFVAAGETEPDFALRYEPKNGYFHFCRNWDDAGGIGEGGL